MDLDPGVRYFRVTCVTAVWCNPFYFLVAKDMLLLRHKLRYFLVMSCYFRVPKVALLTVTKVYFRETTCLKQNALWHESHYFRVKLCDMISYILSRT